MFRPRRRPCFWTGPGVTPRLGAAAALALRLPGSEPPGAARARAGRVDSNPAARAPASRAGPAGPPARARMARDSEPVMTAGPAESPRPVTGPGRPPAQFEDSDLALPLTRSATPPVTESDKQ